MIAVTNDVGRLLHAVFVSPVSAEDLAGFAQTMQAHFKRSSQTFVAFTDLRKAGVLAPDVSANLVAVMRSDNPRIERNAMIIGEGATFGMQAERVVREANHKGRRVFRDPNDLAAWLSEVLGDAERTYLSGLLAKS